MRPSAHSRTEDRSQDRSLTLAARNRTNGHFHGAALAALLLPLAFAAQPALKREAGGWTRTYTATLPAAVRIRVNGHGPVSVTGGGHIFSYTLKVKVAARTEAEARRILERVPPRVSAQGDSVLLTAPGGPIMSSLSIQAPRLTAVVIDTSDGDVTARGIDGTLAVDSRAGDLDVDRIGGQCNLVTGGGDVRVGEVAGALHCVTGGGRIIVNRARGEATLVTSGGDIVAGEMGAAVRAETGAGGIRIRVAGGPVTATTGGGEIVVDKADGVVTVRNMAGPVAVGAAPGVHCESGSGGIRLTRIAGPLHVSTTAGNILADLLAGRAASGTADSFLATGSGDITVVIPSNVGVNIRAENALADTLRRIVSDYAGVGPQRQGNRIVARGAVNGGGPLLQISDAGGTIFIKRQ